MKYLVSVAIAMSLLASNAHALGKREQGVLIGLGSAIVLGSVLDRDDRYDDYYDPNNPSDVYYGRYRGFPKFRCEFRSSVQCAYERGRWERARDEWYKDKDRAYRCGRYGECDY